MACNRLLTFFLVCHFLKRFLSKTIHMSPPGSPHGRHDGSFLSWLASDKSIKGCRYMQGAKNACIVPSVAIYIKNQWPIEIIWVHKLPQIWICFYPRPRLRILYQLPAFIWPTRHFLESIVFWIGLPKRPHSSSILYEDPYLISSYVFNCQLFPGLLSTVLFRGLGYSPKTIGSKCLNIRDTPGMHGRGPRIHAINFTPMNKAQLRICRLYPNKIGNPSEIEYSLIVYIYDNGPQNTLSLNHCHA